MRLLIPSIGAIAMMASPLGLAQSPAPAQQSLCNPCVDPPTRIRRNDFVSPNATIVVTAEDMRNLGVISVADMINQLPSSVARESAPGAASASEQALPPDPENNFRESLLVIEDEPTVVQDDVGDDVEGSESDSDFDRPTSSGEPVSGPVP